MNSLQARLIMGALAVFAIGFLIAGLTVYGFFRSTMYAEFDDGLHTTIRALAALTRESDDSIILDFEEGFDEFTQPTHPSYYEVWVDGKVIKRSPRLTAGDLAMGYGSLARPQHASVDLPDGRPGRQACVTFQPRAIFDDDDYEDDDDDDLGLADRRPVIQYGGPPIAGDVSGTAGVIALTWERPERNVTIAVARDATHVETQLRNLRWILGSVGTAIATICCVMLVIVVRHGIRPVQTVTQTLSEIDEHSLNSRISTGQVPTEIAPLVTRLNDLLSRLEEAFLRERAFSSNLAHELRTPLAGLKSTLEVYLSRLHEPHEYQAAMTACLQICDQSHNLVENLLALARVEGKTLQCQLEDVNLDDVFRECWHPLAEDAIAKEITTDFQISRHEVSTDREMLRVILRNVLSNAVCHSEHGGRIEANLTNGDGTLKLTVGNTGKGISQLETDKVFDRLWRGDEARAQTGEHFGLGLTLTKRFVETLGGTVRVDVDEMFRITISLPV